MRILIGRAIALALLLGYELSVKFLPPLGVLFFLVGLFVFPWLVVSSIRFNARNTSYRNVRFNFAGTDVEAFVAYMVWPFVGMITMGLLWPLAQKKKDTFYVNGHNYGGRYFEADISTARLYAIFTLGLVLIIALAAALGTAFVYLISHGPSVSGPLSYLLSKKLMVGAIVLAIYAAIAFIGPAIHTMILNLVVSSTTFDEKHQLKSTMSPIVMAWIFISNAILVLITLGLFYPWARVRARRYQLDHLTLLIQGDVDSYVSEVFDTQSAVGEEIGSVFSFDFGL